MGFQGAASFLWKATAFGLMLAGMLGAVPVIVLGQDTPPGYQYDPENAEEIMELCAGCHGEFGQGGGAGEYPRLAGLPAKYLASQLRAYQNGERESIAMVPYANDRELPEQDLLDIATYLSSIDLPRKMPDIDPDLDSYEKLLIASRVFNVARLEGDLARGEEVYSTQCRKCHGPEGWGARSVPQIAGQYSDYIRLQIADFRSGKRVNKPMDKYLAPLSDEDVESLLVYLSTVDD
jgi:cytochrome c553